MPTILSELEPKSEVNEETQALLRRRRNTINRLLNEYFGLIVILVVASVFMAAFIFLIKPKYKEILDSINTTFFTNNQLAPKYKQLEDYKDILRSYKAIDPAQIKKVDDMIPPRYIKQDLFTELVFIIAKKGFVVNSLDITGDSSPLFGAVAGAPGAQAGAVMISNRQNNDTATSPSDSANIGVMTAKVSVNKIDYPGLKVLLGVLENSLRIIDVKSVTFNPANNTANLTLDTYYYAN